jgi:rod shape-determining protein MreD
MTWTRGAVIRLVFVGLFCGILQLTTISQIELFGSTADLSPLLVGVVGLLGGPIAGAAFGFSLGLFMDIALLQTLGVSSLVLSLVGYAAGGWKILRDPQGVPVVMVIGALCTAGAILGFAVIQFLLGVEPPFSWQFIGQVVVTIILNTLLAYPVCRLVSRIMRRYLPDDSRRSRRRGRLRSNGPLVTTR